MELPLYDYFMEDQVIEKKRLRGEIVFLISWKINIQTWFQLLLQEMELQECYFYKIFIDSPSKSFLLYGPGFAGQGINIPVYEDLEKLRQPLLQQLEAAQGYGYLKSTKLPNFLLVS